MKRQLLSVLPIAFTVAALAGCGSGGSDSASAPKAASSQSDAAITISDFKFVPETLTVPHGAHVRVTNSDGAPHTVTADDGHSFDSGTVATDASATIRVAKTGHFAYHCTIHPYMKGELVVE